MRYGVQYRYYYHESRCCGAMKLIGHDSKSATEWIMHNVRPELHKSIYDEVAVNCPATKHTIPAERLDDPIWKLGFVLEIIERFVDSGDMSIYDMGFVCIVAEDVTCEVKE